MEVRGKTDVEGVASLFQNLRKYREAELIGRDVEDVMKRHLIENGFADRHGIRLKMKNEKTE